MRILIISQYFWPESFRINDIAHGLVEKGHEVSVLTGKPNYPNGKFYPNYGFLKNSSEKLNNIRIIRAPLIPRGKNNKILLAMNYFSFAFFASIVGLMRCTKPDVIFVYEPSPITVGIPAIVYRKFKKVPILFWVQDLWPETLVGVNAVRSPSVLSAIKKLVKFIYQRCDYILTTSRGFSQSIKQHNIKDERIKYFPQYAEAIFTPLQTQDIDHTIQLPKGFTITFSGNIGKAQDIDVIIQAAKVLKNKLNIKWIFLGDGSEREYLLKQIKMLDLHEQIYWLGQKPVDLMPHYYALSDALIVTLRKDPIYALTIPAKLQSYLASGKPILGVCDGEAQRIIQDSNSGFAANSGDIEGLAKHVETLIGMQDSARKQMGMNGRKYYLENFERTMLLDKLENWMNELKG